VTRVISWKELNEDFSTSCCNGKNKKIVNEMIKNFLGFEPDGAMTNLSGFKIMLDNVLDIFDRRFIVLDKTDYPNGNYMLKIKVILK
jgi:hypothetical protein